MICQLYSLNLFMCILARFIFSLSNTWQMSTRQPLSLYANPSTYSSVCGWINHLGVARSALEIAGKKSDLPPVLWQNNDVPWDPANLFGGATPQQPTDTHFIRPARLTLPPVRSFITFITVIQLQMLLCKQITTKCNGAAHNPLMWWCIL